jgi:hypothetical protein
MRNFITFTLFPVYLNDKIKANEMGKACSTSGGEEECIEDIGGKARRKETTGKTKTYVGEEY